MKLVIQGIPPTHITDCCEPGQVLGRRFLLHQPGLLGPWYETPKPYQSAA